MSRFVSVLMSLALCGVVSAQVKVVKDAEHILGTAKPDYAAALNTIRPALTHEETKSNVNAWMCAGKAAIGVWDKMILSVQLGQAVKDDQKKTAAHDLVDAYTYLTTALPLDSLPNEKGKIKPKNSKEIHKLLAKNYRSYRNAGIFLYDLKDYAGAYDAWEIYLTMPQVLNVKHKVVKPDPDGDLGQVYFYQSLCALKTNRNSDAIDKLVKARSTGYSSKELYLYGVEAARREKNDSVMLEFATLGAKLYGKQEVSFTLLLINDRLAKKDYSACRTLVEEALAAATDDKVKSQLYDVMGVLDDSGNDFEAAIANFQKAVVYDDANAKAYFDLARVIYNESLRIAENDSLGGMSKATPGLEKAAEYFEKAYKLDGTLSQIPETLYSIYYRLGVGFEDKASYWAKKQ